MRNLKTTILYALFFSAITTVASAQDWYQGVQDFNTAYSYTNAGKYNEAIRYYKMALVNLVKISDAGMKYQMGAKTFNQLSFCYRALKQYDQAIKTALMGLSIPPSKFPKSALYFNLGQAYKGKKQDNKAIDALKKSIELAPKDADGYAALANILDDKKDYAEAITYWKKAAELNPNNLPSLALSYYCSGKYNDALDALNKYFASLTFGDINVEFKIADNYPVIVKVSEGVQKEGLQPGDKIVKVGKKSTKKKSAEEIANWMKGEKGTKITLEIMRAGARKTFTKTLTREETLPITAFTVSYIALRGLIKRQRGKKEEALKDAERAYSLGPMLPYPKIALGASSLDRGQYDQSIKLLAKVHSDDNPLIEVSARLLEATAYAQKHDFKKAINIYSAIPDRELSPKDVPIWSDKNILLQILKPFATSKKKNAEELQAKGKYKEALDELGDALKLADDVQAEEIVIKMSKIIKKDPQLSTLPEEARKYAVTGDMLTEQGEFEEALEQYRQALQQAPYIAKLYFDTATTCGKLKRYFEAIRYLKIYLQLAPKAPDARAAQDQIYKWEFMSEKGDETKESFANKSKPGKNKKKKVSLYLSPEAAKKLKSDAAKEDKAQSDIIENLLREK